MPPANVATNVSSKHGDQCQQQTWRPMSAANVATNVSSKRGDQCQQQTWRPMLVANMATNVSSKRGDQCQQQTWRLRKSKLQHNHSYIFRKFGLSSNFKTWGQISSCGKVLCSVSATCSILDLMLLGATRLRGFFLGVDIGSDSTPYKSFR